MQKPLYARKATPTEQRKLNRMASSSGCGRETRKALAIRMSLQNETTTSIASRLNLSDSTVRRWIHAFNAEGLDSIPNAEIPGRPRTADEEFDAATTEALAKSPKDCGYDATVWSADLLRGHLYLVTRAKVCQRTMYNVLHRLGYSYKRPKLDLKHKQNPKEVSRAKRETASAKKTSLEIQSASLSRILMKPNSISIPN